uniref:Uncharacterized protein n=1 Tax=Chelonoidis abingdonii TaxID=106734 RepID=A0A8C0ITH2_CHEAB
MSNSNTTQETLEIMKESEKKLVEESVNKNKFVSRSPSKEEVEKEGEEANVRQESQVRTWHLFILQSQCYHYERQWQTGPICGGSHCTPLATPTI